MAGEAKRLPVYREAANEIIDRIKGGELVPGGPAPSARQLMESTGMSSATAARVLGVLRDEGWIDTVPGRGSFVRTPNQLTQGADRLGMLRSGGTGLSDGERVEILEGRTEAASQEVADALGIEAGERVAVRRRRYIDAAGVSAVSSTWISGALAEHLPEFTLAEPLPKMTFGLLEDRTGRRASRRRDAVSVRPVPDDVAALLDVQTGRDVLVVTNRYCDQNGEPTEYAVDYHAPGRELVSEYDLD
ncbi:GntR family transcriptional regulator [Streptomyces albidochromogenes]|uniref:GntR family transcriptional regulator n=1 Tax=Streptomyces albidochromogenes TaxID=329524 RepID=UPI00110FA767|nr:GntR family transcriptional regulator [Streptomyces albidochromogenes]